MLQRISNTTDNRRTNADVELAPIRWNSRVKCPLSLSFDERVDCMIPSKHHLPRLFNHNTGIVLIRNWIITDLIHLFRELRVAVTLPSFAAACLLFSDRLQFKRRRRFVTRVTASSRRRHRQARREMLPSKQRLNRAVTDSILTTYLSIKYAYLFEEKTKLRLIYTLKKHRRQ